MFETALATFVAIHARSFVLHAHLGRAECALALGRPSDALAATDIVIGELEGSARDPNLRAAAYRVRAGALRPMGMLDAASAAADTDAEIARVVEAKSERGGIAGAR